MTRELQAGGNGGQWLDQVAATVRRWAWIAVAIGCGDGPIEPPTPAVPADVVGSYMLSAVNGHPVADSPQRGYEAAACPFFVAAEVDSVRIGPDGELRLRADSTFTLSVAREHRCYTAVVYLLRYDTFRLEGTYDVAGRLHEVVTFDNATHFAIEGGEAVRVDTLLAPADAIRLVVNEGTYDYALEFTSQNR